MKLKSVIKFCILVLSLFLGAGVIVYNFFPTIALAGMYKIYALQADMSLKETTLDGYPLTYYQGGQGPKLILLHGYGDRKIAFLQSARTLSKHYQLLLPQLPGHGDAKQDKNRNYSIRSQVEFLNRFVEEQGWKKFYLGGNSMGGHISAAFALRYPGKVTKLVLLNPAGLLVDDPIPYKNSKAPMKTDADFEAYMKDAFVKTPWVPAPFKKHFIASSQKNFLWSNKLRKHIREGEDYILGDRIKLIKVPTLIIWGDGDGIVKPVHAPVWHKNVPGSKLIIMKAMGHGPQYERPGETARLIDDFLK